VFRQGQHIEPGDLASCSIFVRNPQHCTQLHLPQRLFRCINTRQSGDGGKRRLCLRWNMPRCVNIVSCQTMFDRKIVTL